MASMLWQTSFIVRALSPLSLDHAFRHLRLLLHFSDGDLQLNPCSFSSHDYPLHKLCLSLLRAAAATTTSSPFFVAFPVSINTISVVFPTSRKVEMEHTVQHVLTYFPEVKVDCMADDEFGCGLAMENALLWGLAEALVCNGWVVFEGNLAVHGGIMDWIDGTPTEAIAFAAHTERNDCIDFLLSPDVIRIQRFKIERILLGPLKKLFDGGAVVILDNYLENMSPDNAQDLKCLTLPSLKEGFVSGHSIYSIKPLVPSKLGVPVFSKRKIREVQLPGARKAEGEIKSQKENLKICMEQGKSFSKKPQGSNSNSMAGVTAVILPKKKRVCVDQESNTEKKLGVAKINCLVGEISEGFSPLKKQKAPDYLQPSYQKLEMLSKGVANTCNAMIKSITCVKQPPQDKCLLVNGSIKQQEEQSTSKTKVYKAQKVAASGEKKSGRGEKKTIDSETNQKKVLSKYAAGKLSDLTVPELKVFLGENKAKVSGKKEELVQRLVQVLSSLKSP